MHLTAATRASVPPPPPPAPDAAPPSDPAGQSAPDTQTDTSPASPSDPTSDFQPSTPPPPGHTSLQRLLLQPLEPAIAQQIRRPAQAADTATASRTKPLALGELRPLRLIGDGDGARRPGDFIASGSPIPQDPTPAYTKPLRVDLPATPPTPTAQAAAEVAAAAGAAPSESAAPDGPTVPKADPLEIAALELLLAEPGNQAMVRHFGGELKPLPTWSTVGQGIAARYGADLGARLNQLQTAQRAVKAEYLQALDEAQRSPGPDVPGSRLMASRGDPFNLWDFDPAEFTRAWAQGDSPAQQAFAHLYGPDPVYRVSGHGEGTEDQWVLGGLPLGGDVGRYPTELKVNLPTLLDPDRITKLHDQEMVWFDPQLGWSTDSANLKESWLSQAVPAIFVGVATAGAATVVMGATMGAASTTAAVAAQGAAVGALTSAASQLLLNGGISFKDMLKSALSGGATAGLLHGTGLDEMTRSASLGERIAGYAGRAGVQGAVQQAIGGEFSDGFVNSALASLGSEITGKLNAQIDTMAPALSGGEASALRLLARAAGSAVRVMGNPGDPAAGFANDFLGGMLGNAIREEMALAQGQGALAQVSGGQTTPTADPLGEFIDQHQTEWDPRGDMHDPLVGHFGQAAPETNRPASSATLDDTQGIDQAGQPIAAVGSSLATDASSADDPLGELIGRHQAAWAARGDMYDQLVERFSNADAGAYGPGVQVAGPMVFSEESQGTFPVVTVHGSRESDEQYVEGEFAIPNPDLRFEPEDAAAGGNEPPLSALDRAALIAQGVLYDLPLHALQDAAYQFGIAGTPDSRAVWAQETAQNTMEGIVQLASDPVGTVSNWWGNLRGNDPDAVRNAATQGAGAVLGAVGAGLGVAGAASAGTRLWRRWNSTSGHTSGGAYVGGRYVHDLKPRSNAELYGTAITRTSEEAREILIRAGHDREMVEQYNFVVLDDANYQRMANEIGRHFDATYGRVPPGISVVTFEQHIASTNIDGSVRIPVWVRAQVFESDEAIVQILTHEMFEVEELRYMGRMSGRAYGNLVRDNLSNNLHYHAVIEGDEWLRHFRELNKSE